MRLGKAGPVVFVWETPYTSAVRGTVVGEDVVPGVASLQVSYEVHGRRDVPQRFAVALAQRLSASPKTAGEVLDEAVAGYLADDAADERGVTLRNGLPEDACLGPCAGP